MYILLFKDKISHVFTVILPIQIPYLLTLLCLSSKISFCPQQESWVSRKMEMNECFLHVTQNIFQITVPKPLLVQLLKTCFKCFSHAPPILPSLLRIILNLYCQDKEPLQLHSIPYVLPLLSVQVHRSCSASVPPPGSLALRLSAAHSPVYSRGKAHGNSLPQVLAYWGQFLPLHLSQFG